MVNVLGMHILLFCILLCTLANIRFGQIEIRKVGHQDSIFFSSFNDDYHSDWIVLKHSFHSWLRI